MDYRIRNITMLDLFEAESPLNDEFIRSKKPWMEGGPIFETTVDLSEEEVAEFRKLLKNSGREMTIEEEK